MEREKPTFDILGRIERERLSRGWSEYALAENSGLTQSTISTWRRRNLQPNVASLEKICSGLGISLSQFFQEEDSVYLTSDQKELLDPWAKLSPAQRTAVSQMLRSFLYIKEEENYHKIFSLYDGIPGYIFNSPVQITDDNTIWWGNECGLVCYDAAKSWSEIGTKEVQPPVITSISVAGRPLCPGETLMPVSAPFIDEVFLSVNDNNISFTFSALNYAVENTDLYEYCLEEYDKEWKTLMKGNQVSYTELPVGDYMFRVRAASNPAAIKAVRVVVAGNTPFIRWIVVLSVVVCCILIYFYSGLLGKYRTMKEYINKKTESSEENRKEKYQKSRMEEKTAMLIIGKLNECMEKDRLYLNPDLKLQDVAKVVKCNTGELSQVLNMFMNIGFTDYVNKYRIDEFIKRIQDKSASRYTLVSLSEQCGFSSRTSFFRSFKKFKGMSPAEYIKEHGIFIE